MFNSLMVLPLLSMSKLAENCLEVETEARKYIESKGMDCGLRDWWFQECLQLRFCLGQQLRGHFGGREK
jgi:hypothetical protein